MASLGCANTQSATLARAFLHVARTSFRRTPLYEFLLPRRSFHGRALRSDNTQCVHHGAQALRAPQRRPFSASPARRQTRCIHNPQRDADDRPMSLELTPRAARRLGEIMTKDANPGLALRIQVESGGCHGFQYLMSLVTLPPPDGPAGDWSAAVGEDDSVFQYLPDDAEPDTRTTEGPKVVIDQPSLDLLKGSKVDFTMELIGSQFKIVDNPHATSSCGCGTSFDIKI